jgi:hypothetical protein
MKPQIIVPDYGKHNAELEASAMRIADSAAWKRLDTVMLIPASGSIPTKVVMSWMNLYGPPNNSLFRMPTIGTIDMEVGEAFSQSIEFILNHPDLSKYKYLLTVEHDNAPPPDGLIKLQRYMEAHPEYDCIGGLYWTKGPEGVPQCWGDPRDPVPNYRPQTPVPGQLMEVQGTGMGFNLWRLDMFKDPDLQKPFFKTQVEGGIATQDLAFWSKARPLGYRCAIACDVLVGHYDLEGKFGPPDTMW